MWFEESDKKTKGIEFESRAENSDPDVDEDVSVPIRIPFRIDDGILVRSLAKTTLMAKSRIIGVMHGQFILITEPAVQINERFSTVLDENFLCSYFCEGSLYNFASRYRRELMNDVVCIEYPKEVEIRQIRKDRRIRVNIEVKVVVSGTTDALLGDMTDISRGGCGLVLKQRVRTTKGDNVSLTFSLPNEAFVSELRGVVARATRIQNGKATEIGLTFAGPPDELAKVANFCEFCMFFDLE